MNIGDAREVLQAELPQATLLIGPGSQRLAEFLFECHSGRVLGRGVRRELPARRAWMVAEAEADIASGQIVARLDAAAARMVASRAYVAPVAGDFKIVMISLDGSTEAAQNILLKVLEEPPPTCRFILIGSRRPLATVVSRCHVYTFAAGGSVALREDPELKAVRSAVGVAVKAAMAGQGDLLDSAFRTWTPEHTAQLQLWLTEQASGRWRHFAADFVPSVTSQQALRLLTMLRSYQGARTGARAALDQVFAV